MYEIKRKVRKGKKEDVCEDLLSSSEKKKYVCSRYRVCNNPYPSILGHYCEGSAQDIDSCNGVSCGGNIQYKCCLVASFFAMMLKIEFGH
ncbi:hypothetical protein DPMN_029547 [Dreissena polymorpha]|uniref:Uncharacterized protein n=1 Tax=Dreissena polymorpha TaxID=45954 RepID=A0A9D4LXF7_DREPO|nr:hypothetical protein DPMN_029547 [Dreissena polymorpha]